MRWTWYDTFLALSVLLALMAGGGALGALLWCVRWLLGLVLGVVA